MLDSHLQHIGGKISNGTAGKPIKEGSPIVLLDKNIQYRTSLMPAIWTKECLLSYMKPGYSAHDVEQRGMVASHSDKFRLISYSLPEIPFMPFDHQTNHVVSMVNLFRFNKPQRTTHYNGLHGGFLQSEDVEYLEEMFKSNGFSD